MMTRRLRALAWLVLAAALLAPMGALAVELTGATPAVLAQAIDPRSDYELWLVVGAFLTTVISALLLQLPQHLPRLAKQAIVAVIAAALSGVGLFYGGQLDTDNWRRTWMLVFLGATAVYVVLWEPISKSVKAASP